jgi:hypothetical protein
MKVLLTEKQMKRLVDKLIKTDLKDTTIKDLRDIILIKKNNYGNGYTNSRP